MLEQKLRAIADPDYAALSAKLIPGMPAECFIGCRTPALRKLAGELDGTAEAEEFLRALPHFYHDENQLHAFLLSRMRDFDRCLAAVEAFLPYINNWATCDQLSPAAFKKQPLLLLPAIGRWLESTHIYTVRFAIGMLMQHFLEEHFSSEYPERLSRMENGEYYINTELAWYFATALAKQPDAILPYFTEHRLPAEVQKKAIRKSIESYRIPDETKALLRQL